MGVLVQEDCDWLVSFWIHEFLLVKKPWKTSCGILNHKYLVLGLSCLLHSFIVVPKKAIFLFQYLPSMTWCFSPLKLLGAFNYFLAFPFGFRGRITFISNNEFACCWFIVVCCYLRLQGLAFLKACLPQRGYGKTMNF